jgi:hypothetical protein
MATTDVRARAADAAAGAPPPPPPPRSTWECAVCLDEPTEPVVTL